MFTYQASGKYENEAYRYLSRRDKLRSHQCMQNKTVQTDEIVDKNWRMEDTAIRKNKFQWVDRKKKKKRVNNHKKARK